MSPYFADGQVTIYHGDVLDVLVDMETSVDVVITDPPYASGSRLVSPARTRVLLALVELYECDGSATVTGVAAHAGLAGKGSVHPRLAALRDLGLIDWEPGKQGTLRPRLRVVAHG